MLYISSAQGPDSPAPAASEKTKNTCLLYTSPLSLGQESECECVDVKTEAEAPDFAQWKTALNAIMPRCV